MTRQNRHKNNNNKMKKRLVVQCCHAKHKATGSPTVPNSQERGGVSIADLLLSKVLFISGIWKIIRPNGRLKWSLVQKVTSYVFLLAQVEK